MAQKSPKTRISFIVLLAVLGRDTLAVVDVSYAFAFDAMIADGAICPVLAKHGVVYKRATRCRIARVVRAAVSIVAQQRRPNA